MGVEDRGGYVNALMDLAPDLRQITLQFAFGEIFQRPGLDLKSRVVCTTAALTALRADGAVTEFPASRAARRVYQGLKMVEVLMQTGGYAGYPAALNALSIAGTGVGVASSRGETESVRLQSLMVVPSDTAWANPGNGKHLCFILFM